MTSAALNNPKDYALYYLHNLDLSVFVLKTSPPKERKQPAVESTDPYFERKPTDQEVDGWFKFDLYYNVAIALGAVSQAVAFDVDGPNAVERIKSKIPEMSSTLREAFANTMKNKTGSGGEHVVFKIEGYISDLKRRQLWTDGKPHSQILILANKSYIVAAPSVHENSRRYEWNGKDPVTITRQELDEFIRLVSSESQREQFVSVNSKNISESNTELRSLTVQEMQDLYGWIKAYYTPGNRDHIIFYLSGMMRKANISHESARRVITLLCNASEYSDEDLDKSLTVVDNTYRKPLNELNGKSGLHDLLVTSYETSSEYDDIEYLKRVDTFSNICQIFNGEPPSSPTPPSSNSDDDDANDDDDYRNRPGQWLRRQQAADKNLSVIETVCNEILRTNYFKTLADTDEILWYDNDGYYRPGGENRIGMQIVALGGYNSNTTVKREVLLQIRERTKVDRSEFDKDKYLVCFKNCVVDLWTGKTFPHDPERYLFTQQIPWAYKKISKPPKKILSLLYNALHPRDVTTAIEFIGYCLIRDSSLFQKALMCAGPPNNSKSTFLSLVGGFLGKENVSNKTLQQLVSVRFATASLFGKLANIFADLEGDRLDQIGMFKVVVAGDTIDAEWKGKNSFTFRPYAKLMYSANVPPLPPEKYEDDDAYYKRWLILAFSLRKLDFFTGQPVVIDEHLADNILTDEEEMSGLAFMAVKTAQRLLTRHGFTYTSSIDTVREQYMRKAKPVVAWVKARCVLDESYESEKQSMHEDFVQFCNVRQLPHVDIANLGKQLKPFYVTDAKTGPKNNRTHLWKGIALRKDLRAKGQLALDEPDELDSEDYEV